MPRKRQIEVNEATRAQIKQIARDLMQEKGSAGLSLRAIARSMGISAPALYHYFDSLDDLITALIVDAFTGHAEHVRAARDAAAAQGLSPVQQLHHIMLAYREWGLKNRSDFQLIFGNPIPGYKAPADITTPAARTMTPIVLETVQAAMESGAFQIAPIFQHVPVSVSEHFQREFGLDEDSPMLVALWVMNHSWGLMHGLTSLEVHNHLRPVVGDTDAFYEQTIRNHLQSLGLKLD